MSLEGLQLGRYRLMKLLGHGGMGEVYLAEDPYLNRQVVVKIIRPMASPQFDIEEAIRRFHIEMRAIGMLDHPNILPLFDYGEGKVKGMTLTFMAMQFRPEGSFAAWLHSHNNLQSLSLQDISYFLQHAADALQHAHDHQIIHRDVKPANFLLRTNKEKPSNPHLLLADFGIAKLATLPIGPGGIPPTIPLGTPTYTPPEQWEGKPVLATDQYALAAMTYQLLTGRPPFQGDQKQMIYQHFNTRPEPPSKHNPSIPEAIDPVILRALTKNPADRYPSISEFAQDFKQAVQSTEKGADMHMILAISEAEALMGGPYPLTLPKGQQVIVTVPEGTKAGWQTPLKGKGKRNEHGGQPGDLIVTVAVKPAVDKEKLLIQHLERISTDTAILKSMPISEQAITRQLDDLTKRIDKVQLDSTDSNRVIRNRLAKGLTIIMVALAMIIVGSSVGLFYFMNQMITTNAIASNDAISHMATSFAHATGATSKTPVANQTPVANLNTYAPSQSALVLDDRSLSNKNWTRDLHTQDQSTCEFKAGTFQVMQNSRGFIHNCPYLGTDFHNFTFEVQMKIISGSGGIFFDADQYNINFYYFYISNGNYGFDIYSSGNGHYRNLMVGSYQNISKSVKIAVVANNSSFDLYANNQFLTSVSDNTFPGGQIGVAAGRGNSLVQFSEARVWIL